MLNKSSSSLYECMNVSNYRKVIRTNNKNSVVSPSSLLGTSTGDSSTCHDDSTTIDGNDSAYYETINTDNYGVYFEHRKSDDNGLTNGVCDEKICKNCDKLIRQVTTLKEQLYSDWSNRIKPLHDGIAIKQDIIDCYKKQIECYKIELDKNANEIIKLKESLKISQKIIEQQSNALKDKQQECENTKILLDDALNSLNIERYNFNTISNTKCVEAHKIESNNHDIAGNSQHLDGVNNGIFSGFNTRYDTSTNQDSPNITHEKSVHTTQHESVDLEIFK